MTPTDRIYRPAMRVISRTGLTEYDQLRYEQIQHDLAHSKKVFRFIRRFRHRGMIGIAR